MLATLVAFGMCAWFCMCGLSEGKSGGGGGGVGAAISACLATWITTKLSPDAKREEEEKQLKHEAEMAKLRKELEKGDKDDPKNKDKSKQVAENDKKNRDIINKAMSDPKVTAIMSKSTESIKDPVKKEQMSKHMDMIRCAQYDSEGKPRTSEDMQNWLSKNIPEEDLQSVIKAANDQYADVEISEETLKEAADSTPDVSEEDIAAEKDKAVKVSKDLGPKLEADAAKRNEMKAEIERLEKEKADKQSGLDKAIADAGADEEAIKKAKLAKAEFNKDMDNQIFGKKKEAAEFESKCQTAEFLNTLSSDRKTRVEKAIKQVEEDHKKAIEAADKEIEAAGGKPEDKNTKDKDTKSAEGKPGDKDKPSKTDNGDDKTETVKMVDKDGEPNGAKLVKSVDKDGKETYKMFDKDNPEGVDIDKEDYEQEKKRADDAAKDLADDETNGDDEKGGDVDADEKDTDAEEVDDGKGGKKKVLKNPAQIWHRKKKKSGGSTKSYYNKKGDSISQKEFQEKMQKYKAKTKNESLQEFLRNPFVMERASKYTTLRDRMKSRIHSIE